MTYSTTNTNVVDESGFHYDPALNKNRPPAPEYGLPITSTPAKSSETDLSNSLKLANSGIEERLDKLINLGTSSKSDKNLNITSQKSFKPRPGENIFEAYQRQREERFTLPDDKTGEAIANSTIKPADTTTGYTQFTESLKAANKGIEQRLDRLLDSMAVIHKAPRSLTVMSPNPVDDAASIINDLSRGELVGAGL